MLAWLAFLPTKPSPQASINIFNWSDAPASSAMEQEANGAAQ